MRTVEDCLTFIEDELGLQLLDVQKEMLYKLWKDKPYYYYPNKCCGFSTLNSARILLEILKKENGNDR